MADTDYFSESYLVARDRFRLTVVEAGGSVESLPLIAKGPDGDDLTIDIGWSERNLHVGCSFTRPVCTV